MSEELLSVLLPETLNETLQLPDPGLLQFYKDLDNRAYWINSEIESGTLDLVSKIIDWNREDRNIPVEERRPIKLFINSPGGSLDIEEAIVNTIELSKTPVWGIAMCTVASAASMIYLSCHKKYALRNSYFLLHKGSCKGIEGSYEEVQSFFKDYEKQINKMMEFYVTHTKYTKQEIEDNIRTDWYVRGQEILDKGLVDEIIEDIEVML